LTSSAKDEPSPSGSDADLAQRLVERTLQLAASTRELTEFAATLSHDVRAPLRSIEGFSRILLQPPYIDQIDETGLDYLQRIHQAGLRLMQMTQEMLQLVQIGQGGVQSEQVDLSAMAQQILADLQAGAPTRRADLLVEPGLSVTGDSRLLRLLLENLLGNAWKFTKKNELPRVFMGRATDEGVPAICVRDNGVGFDQQYAGKLFRLFQRLHADAEFEGIGVGLAKAQRAVHAHGGRIWARAKPDIGATFIFTLPGLAAASTA